MEKNCSKKNKTAKRPSMWDVWQVCLASALGLCVLSMVVIVWCMIRKVRERMSSARRSPFPPLSSSLFDDQKESALHADNKSVAIRRTAWFYLRACYSTARWYMCSRYGVSDIDFSFRVSSFLFLLKHRTAQFDFAQSREWGSMLEEYVERRDG